MIGLSIVALTLLLSGTPAENARIVTATHATSIHVLPSVKLPSVKRPSVKLPRVPMPNIRMPHFPKRHTDDAPLELVSRRLKAMVGEQESWYADHGRYGTQPDKFTRRTVVTDSSTAVADAPRDHVQIQVLYAGKKGWTAIASHPDAPGKNCVVYVGSRGSLPMVPRTRADATEATAEALPACDR